MAITLITNPGSASKKYALYVDGVRVFTARFEVVSEGFVKCFEINGGREECEDVAPRAFHESADEFMELLLKHEVISKIEDIASVVIRIVVPGTFFQSHRVVDDVYIKKVRAKEHIAPLHIPPILAEISAIRKSLPRATLIGASDSAFHATIPHVARTYSIHPKDTEKLDLYRFGYHGISAAAVVRTFSRLLGKTPNRTVLCHVGSGISITALVNGISIDTSMGFAPGSGLMMGTRVGDIDPGALIYLLESKDLDDKEAHIFVQKEGGLKALLGNSDLRVALERSIKGDPRAAEAVSMYFYRIRKYIGASIAALGGIDMLVLTGTAAERNPLVRHLIVSGLEGLGIILDVEKNDLLGNREGQIEHSTSVKILVAHTDEIVEMARIGEEMGSSR